MPKAQLQYLASEVQKLKDQGLYQNLRVLEGAQLPVARFDGHEVINLSSNNYLGLATHPKLKQRALEALKQCGVGSGAVRTIAGTMAIHMELEKKIAEFKGVESAVVFQSGFTANAGTVAAIIGPEDVIISDELNHASIIDGCRLSKAEIKRYPHKDVEACERILKGIRAHSGHKLLITDGVFSMDGDITPLPALVKLAEEYECIMMIDDAHASGVLGLNGRGTVDHFSLHGRVDIQVGTLSKAIGVLGGYVCSTRETIEFLYQRARPFLFSTSHPPAVAAACLAAFELLDEEPGLVERLWANTRFFKAGLTRLGFNTGASETPITPIMVGDAALAHEFSRELFQAGVFAQGIGFPTVAKGKARLRTIVTATHTQDELARALGIFERTAQKLRIL